MRVLLALALAMLLIVPSVAADLEERLPVRVTVPTGTIVQGRYASLAANDSDVMVFADASVAGNYTSATLRPDYSNTTNWDAVGCVDHYECLQSDDGSATYIQNQAVLGATIYVGLDDVAPGGVPVTDIVGYVRVRSTLGTEDSLRIRTGMLLDPVEVCSDVYLAAGFPTTWTLVQLPVGCEPWTEARLNSLFFQFDVDDIEGPWQITAAWLNLTDDSLGVGDLSAILEYPLNTGRVGSGNDLVTAHSLQWKCTSVTARTIAIWNFTAAAAQNLSADACADDLYVLPSDLTPYIDTRGTSRFLRVVVMETEAAPPGNVTFDRLVLLVTVTGATGTDIGFLALCGVALGGAVVIALMLVKRRRGRA